MAEQVKKDDVKKVANARKRVPLGMRNVLTAPKRPGFVRRFVNDTPDRVQAFKDAGYDVVTEDVAVGDDKIGKSVAPGSAVMPSVGGGQRAVLMELVVQVLLVVVFQEQLISGS